MALGGLGPSSAGPDGNLWYTRSGSPGAVGRITPAGVPTSFTSAAVNYPVGITVGDDGNLWFANRGNDSIGRITSAGVITGFTDPTISFPEAIGTGPDGNLWFGNDTDTIGRISTGGAVTSFGGNAISDPVGITEGPDGNLWYTNTGKHSIGRITPSGTVTNFTHPSMNYPEGITSGPDGNLWFANALGDSIGRITPAGVVTDFTHATIVHPGDITAGPDGNLWFTNFDVFGGGNTIGRVTPAGVVTSYAHYSISRPTRITAGPDGNLWFTNFDNRSLGRIGVAASSVPGAPTAVAGVAGAGQATVSWVAPVSDGGSPITGYTVTATPGGHTCSTTGALSCAVTGLTNGVEHTFTVRAANAVGDGPSSSPSTPVVPTACGSVGAGPFSDVAATHPFCTPIEWMGAAGITGGYSDGTFRPGMAVSRQAMASFLWKWQGQPASSLAEPFFADVPVTHQFYGAIQWLAETGLSTGSANPAGGKPLYKPGDTVSRQAMGVFLWRHAGEPVSSLDEPFFADVPASNPFYAAIQWMADSGLSLGTPNLPGGPLYKPGVAVSRQTMAAFLYRYDSL